MHIKTKSGRVIDLPTPEEDARINAGIAADPENPELDEAFFARAKPASEVFDAKTYSGLVALQRKQGERGPGKKPVKVPTTIRFDPDVLDALKSTGRGWQTRVNEAMRAWLKSAKSA